jgi:hypothetical protein
MAYILAILWVLVWGLTGYFSVRAILLCIERKRNEKMMAAYIQHTMQMRNFAERLGFEPVKAEQDNDIS